MDTTHHMPVEFGFLREARVAALDLAFEDAAVVYLQNTAILYTRGVVRICHGGGDFSAHPLE